MAQSNEPVDIGGGVDEQLMINSLDALNVVGLRYTDLMVDNLTCCGDCANARAGDAPFRCGAGYLTSTYSVKALYCPDFIPLDTLPEEPQGDERARSDRRLSQAYVPIDRRTGRNRRIDPDKWSKVDKE